MAYYFVNWIVPFFILRYEGGEVLGWFTVAMSYALLADVSYTALEAKNYKFMISLSKNENSPEISIFFRKSIPILVMHFAFIPLVFIIPILYGKDFSSSAIFAILILVIRIPLVIARSITSYLISRSKNTQSFLIFMSFLFAYISIMIFSGVKIFGFRWVLAYAIGAITMMLVSFIFVIKKH